MKKTKFAKKMQLTHITCFRVLVDNLDYFGNDKHIICGDFNLVADPDLDYDSSYKNVNNQKARDKVLEIIDSCVLCTSVSEYWWNDFNVPGQTTAGTVVFTTQANRPLDCASLCSSVIDCLVFGFNDVTGCSRAGYDFIHEGHICVKVFTDSVDWDEAKSRCEKSYGRLLVIDTKEKLDAFSDYLDSNGYENERMWIGITDSANEGTWVWLNGETVDRTFWDGVTLNDVCMPCVSFSADCGSIEYRNLGDDACDYSQTYVCERLDII
ncbi:C-type lectin galactose-binding isoform-like [Ylistrum balloti]|uniref:C-type lectin galactose-binding isoform-like n=1 Tax=Ylistrum balloti TaxID=509963 RepID=UPI0029059D79|nr:C-type lectin galactose-binding isoform-like [Ylistrum balloti]